MKKSLFPMDPKGTFTSIQTYEQYVEELRFLKGYDFFLYESSLAFSLPHEVYRNVSVPQYGIYWRSPSTSLWCPAAVLYMELSKPLSGIMCPDRIAMKHLGLDDVKANEIYEAHRETLEHNSSLRASILEALGVSEVPHSMRTWFHRGRVIKREGEKWDKWIPDKQLGLN